MRKKSLLLAFLIPLLLLTACARAPQPTAIPTPEPTPAASETPTSVPPTATTPPTDTFVPVPATITAENTANLQIVRKLELPVDPAAIVWASDGKSLFVIAYKDVLLVNAEDMSIIKQVTLPENETLLDVSPDGHSIATTTDFKAIEIKDVLTGQVIQTISPNTTYAPGAHFSPDGSQLIVGSSEELAGLIFDIASGQLVNKATGFETAAPVYTVRFGADASRVVWVARGSIQVEEVATQSLGADIGHEDFITAWSITHSGDLLATSAGGALNGTYTPLLHLWNPTSGKELAKLELSDSALSLAFSPDDALLAITTGDKVQLLDASSQSWVFTNAAHPGSARDARFSPAGDLLATIGADRILALWAVQ